MISFHLLQDMTFYYIPLKLGEEGSFHIHNSCKNLLLPVKVYP